eukprot:TRINITY_DN1965_c0_g1_i3.p1 TRINITY_DN1965_c0_g1~~TRINITY_DN1965_c0_g1_i3.p1  ORF type:complete len:319 (-),score=71.45 TRINITY_DN1965_c0_g1_i3:55-1011(-)
MTIDVEKPLWDQSSFYGRFRHFVWLTNPLNCLHGSTELLQAKEFLLVCREKGIDKEDKEKVVKAMRLTQSSFHPDSGELMNVFGRMSFQVPGGMLLTGAMLHFYKSVPQVMFWQWFNQSFNALVNYTNRNANSPSSPSQLGLAYALATSSALGTALGLNSLIGPRSHPLIKRFVPFAAVAAANCVNIPLMRSMELAEGIELRDSQGSTVAKSSYAAGIGIACVVLSRVTMAAPGMIIVPLVMENMEKKEWFRRRRILHVPFQVILAGAFLSFMVPAACALFPQVMPVSRESLERYDPLAFESIKEHPSIRVLTFNKGL